MFFRGPQSQYYFYNSTRRLALLLSFSCECAVEFSRGKTTYPRLFKKVVTILLPPSNNLSMCGRIFFMCFNQNDIAQQIRCRSRGKNLAIFGFQKFRFSLDKKKLNTSKKFAKCKPVPHFSLYFLFWKNLLVLKNKKSIICVNM